MLLIQTLLALATTTTPAALESAYTPEYALGAVPPASTAILADEGGSSFSYSFIEIGAFSTDLDTANESTDAWRGRASLGLLGFLVLFLDYASESYDVGPVSFDSDSYGLGLGAHFGLGSNFDLVGEAAWMTDDISSTAAVEDGDGWTARVGGRWMVLPMEKGGLELAGGFRWIDRKTILSDGETSAWDAGGRFHFLNAFSVGANYQFLDKDSRWAVDARFSF